MFKTIDQLAVRQQAKLKMLAKTKKMVTAGDHDGADDAAAGTAVATTATAFGACDARAAGVACTNFSVNALRAICWSNANLNAETKSSL